MPETTSEVRSIAPYVIRPPSDRMLILSDLAMQEAEKLRAAGQRFDEWRASRAVSR